VLGRLEQERSAHEVVQEHRLRAVGRERVALRPFTRDVRELGDGDLLRADTGEHVVVGRAARERGERGREEDEKESGRRDWPMALRL
jgi:hypothetical protein